MAALKLLKFTNLEEANHLLNGGIIGANLKDGAIDDLVGKTITFTAPAGTKTFTQGSKYPGRLSFDEIKSQLEAAVANLKVVMVNRRIAFRHASGTPVTLAAVPSTDTARPLLGLSNAAIAGVTYAGPGGASPKVDQFYVQNDTIYALTE